MQSFDLLLLKHIAYRGACTHRWEQYRRYQIIFHAEADEPFSLDVFVAMKQRDNDLMI